MNYKCSTTLIHSNRDAHLDILARASLESYRILQLFDVPCMQDNWQSVPYSRLLKQNIT